jgi:hypothetical protein
MLAKDFIQDRKGENPKKDFDGAEGRGIELLPVHNLQFQPVQSIGYILVV